MVNEGASTGEQLIEAARRNNMELFEKVLEEVGKDLEGQKKDAKIAALINQTRDPLGCTALHVAAQSGSYEVLDYILDQEGVEVDPIDRLNKETPLHAVVKYSQKEPEHGAYLAEMLIEAGSDPRIKNKHGQKPIVLVPSTNTALIDVLQSAEYAHMLGPVAQNNEDDDDGDDDGPSDEE